MWERLETFLVDFVVKRMVMVTCSGTVPFSPLQHVRDLPEFAYLMSLHRSKWPRSVLWHGWLPGLNGISTSNPWAASFGDLVSFHLERCLVLILLTLLIVGLLLTIGMLTIFPWKCLNILMSGLMGARKTVLLWVVLKLLVLVCTSLLLNLLLRTWFGVRLKSMVMLVWSVAVLFCLCLGLCRRFSVLNFGGAILAMQAYWPCHLGIDNLNVAQSIGRLLDHGSLNKSLLLVKDGDLIALVQYMILTRGLETVRVTKVKGHAEDLDVHQGRVRLIDQQGNAEADTAADLGFDSGRITGADIAAWPCSVGILEMNRTQQCDGHKRHQSEGGLGCIIMRTTCGHFGTSVCRTKRDSSVAVDLVASMLRFTLYAPLVVCGASLPTSMTAVQASGTPCSGPDWSCLTVNTNAAVPSPMDNEALIQVSSSCVNPIDMDDGTGLCGLRVFSWDHWARCCWDSGCCRRLLPVLRR